MKLNRKKKCNEGDVSETLEKKIGVFLFEKNRQFPSNYVLTTKRFDVVYFRLW